MNDQRYRIGDVVNGYVWTGTAWVRVTHVPPHRESSEPYPIGHVVNGHRWDGVRWVPLHHTAGAVMAARRTWYRTPIGIAGIGLAGVLGLGVLGAALESLDSVGSTIQDPVTAAASKDTTPVPTDSQDPVDVQPSAPSGTTRVNDWSVKVADVDRDASAAIERANQFNDDPDYGYIIVTLEGTNGADVVKDLQSFTVKFQGSDRTVYRDESFFMVMPKDLATEAAPGGTVRAQFVFDVPQKALDEGALMLVDGVPVALP